MFQPIHAASCALLAACLAIVGCGSGESGVTVKGRVIEKGGPVSIADYQEGVNCIRVVFVPLNEGGATTAVPSQSSNAKQDGSFEIAGNMGNGIPPGKYRVAVQKMSDGPNGPAEVDPWKGRFGVNSSPFVFEVKEEMRPIDIDLSNPPKS